MSYLFGNVINVQPDQPIVLVTAPTRSVAFQIGGSTIHSAFLMYDDSKSKPSWEEHMIMQLKLEHMMLSVTDEISMVGFKQFQHINQTGCDIKGTTDANWGGICVLAIGDLYQLPPVGQSPVYMSPHNVYSLNDFAPNGWEKMQLHELTQIMRQKIKFFARCLNKICTSVPEDGSEEDIMLKSCELNIGPGEDGYPMAAIYLYYQNQYCDEWNERMLGMLPGEKFTSTPQDSRKDNHTRLTDVDTPPNPQDTCGLRKIFNAKVGARIMVTTNIDVSDGLTNGATGTISDIVMNETSTQIKATLVAFDYDTIGKDARCQSIHKYLNLDAVPIFQSEATFHLGRKNSKSFQATRRQFPLTLAWAVTIHKCQSLTLSKVTVDMTLGKGRFAPGQAYVAFSRV